MKKKPIITLSIFITLIFLAGNTHRIIPAKYDPCQTDITHKSHISDLRMFHCIGHTEYQVNPEEDGLLRIKKWDHVHPWMTLEWHLKQGFTKEQALDLLSDSDQ